MTNKTLWLTLITLLGLLVNVACTAQGGTSVPSPTEQVTMFVGSETVECVGVAPQTCLLVKFDPESEWEWLYDGITGFEHEAGFEYELLVNKIEIEDPPADGSSIQYELVDVVSKTPVTSEGNENQSGSGSENGSESGSRSANNDPLAGTSWILERYGPADAPIPLQPNTEITAEFNEGNIEGRAGCNHYFGAYQINEDTITIEQVAQTEMACLEEGIMEQEIAFTTALAEAQSFTLDGETLIMTYENGVLHFTAKSEATNLSLEGTAWQLNTFIEGETARSLLANTEISAQLTEGKINGTAGCNRYFGSYELNGEQITFSGLAATRKACPNDIMEQERTYLAQLQTAERVTIEGETLTITHADGKLVFNAN